MADAIVTSLPITGANGRYAPDKEEQWRNDW